MHNKKNNLFGNTALGDKLKEAIGSEKLKVRPKTGMSKKQLSVVNSLPPLPNPNKYKGDGIDHIWIAFTSNSIIGQRLRKGHPSKFKHPTMGRFLSIENFWMFITSEERDERMRFMKTGVLNVFYKQCTPKNVTNLFAIIANAIWIVVKQDKELAAALKESTLPFDLYGKFNKTASESEMSIKRPAYAVPYIFAVEEIRKALKENREPDFTHLKTNKDISEEEALKA